MKLISCPVCDDIVALTRWKKSCKCGSVYGKYTDKIHAKISPEAIPMACDTNKVVFIEGEAFKKLTFEFQSTIHNGCDIEVGEFDE